ncbi:phage tail tube protein [Piscirickettsia litoralis]|uniref:Lambda phage tail tube protein N-terminal domain-containing protein n=1 Tax=Piscirickettsia litoralis TaxID=1891921 RepID=A0ABX2ZXE1_9GAMM|nr:phage tail tube protein [Piscirickettsia litoralis]ODN41049.1 hypothetical protein BGC07_18645 [Piscirickettsia litoralis]
MSVSIGAHSEFYRDTDNAGNYQKVANITNIGEISSSRDKVDVTEYGSDHKKYQVGLKDHDEIQLDMNLVQDNAALKDLISDYEAGIERQFKIIIPTQPKRQIYEFTALITNHKVTSPMTEAITMSVSLQPTTAIAQSDEV